MNGMLKPLLGYFCVVYFDDILAFSKSFQEYIKPLTKMFQVLRTEKLYLNAHKYEFTTFNVNFLGFIISAKGIQMDPNKVSDIMDWSTPTSLRSEVFTNKRFFITVSLWGLAL